MILLIGATGFLGSHVLQKLMENNKVTCLIRKTSNKNLIEKLKADYIYADLEDYDSICRALKGKETLINIASLGFGHAPNIVKACEEMNVKRTIFVSTTGIYTKLEPSCKSIRLEAEKIIKSSNLDFTIIRPTMIYGSPGDRNIWRLLKYINRSRIIPVFGNGTYLQQPVFVEDVASVIVKAYENNAGIRKSYNISGKQALSYNQLIDTAAKTLDRKIIKFYVPTKLSWCLIKIYEKLSKNPKIKAEQVLRLNENKAFSNKAAISELNYDPISFEEGISREAKHLFLKEG